MSLLAAGPDMYPTEPAPASAWRRSGLSVLRWALLVPSVVFAGYAASTLVATVRFTDTGPVAYGFAFLSGLLHLTIGLYVASIIAPAFRRGVVIVFGVFLVGDLALVHLALDADLAMGLDLPPAGEGAFGLLLKGLGAGEFRDLRYGGLLKVGGAVTAFLLVWRARLGSTLDSGVLVKKGRRGCKCPAD